MVITRKLTILRPEKCPAEPIETCTETTSTDRQSCENTQGCYWCERSHLQFGCYQDSVDECVDKTPCTRQSEAACEENNCEVNTCKDSSTNHIPTYCMTDSDASLPAGKCPTTPVTEDKNRCGDLSSKHDCMIYVYCAWCDVKGNFQCVPDDSRVDGGNCPNHRSIPCDTEHTDKDSCLAADCAWCDGT